jgi:rhomboid family GlyGly-CTERM serine protease
MTRAITKLPRRALLAAGIALAALIAGRFPDSLELVREAPAAGEWWRLWTYALVHANAQHAWFDVGALGGLLLAFGAPRRAAWFALIATPLIGVGTLLAHPEFAATCGLSGVLHGLFVMTALEQRSNLRGWHRALFAGAALAVTAKACCEVYTGVPLFTSGVEFGAPIAFAAHGIGAALGWCFASAPQSPALVVERA